MGVKSVFKATDFIEEVTQTLLYQVRNYIDLREIQETDPTE